MSSRPDAVPGAVSFVGNYPPRKCGIATFTKDLRTAVAEQYPAIRCDVCAINDSAYRYAYAPEVRMEIDAYAPLTFPLAAHGLNLSRTEVVCLQHEFGIYGDRDGENVLELARRLDSPIVTTLHTILEHPTPGQDRVLRELARLSSRVVVMTERARDLLLAGDVISADKIDLVPHGIPDMPYQDTSSAKALLGVKQRFMILTFGLLSANKGIEHMIEALPSILERFPDVVYVVLGATHPNVLREEGERYRDMLKARARQLSVAHAVVFEDRFVDIDELKQYIAAADVYITPYLNPAQIVSGTLAYAFGGGKAVVSTPYLHAVELLADGRGSLVPFASPTAISEAIVGLLDNDADREKMCRRAYQLGRAMIWSEVAQRYMESFEKARASMSERPHSRRRDRAHSAGGKPLESRLNLDHVKRMTDSTGIIQHARFALPHRAEGYCTDDNSRALAVAVQVPQEVFSATVSDRLELVSVYAAFLNHAFNTDTGHFRNFMAYDRTWLDDRGSDDCQGRCVRALAQVMVSGAPASLKQWAIGLLHPAAQAMLETRSPRAWANAIVGLEAYLVEAPHDLVLRRIVRALADQLLACFHSTVQPGWHWFEHSLSYDNAVMPHALLVSGKDDKEVREMALTTLRWLADHQISSHGFFSPVGSYGFFPREGEKARFDQQPIEAAGMVVAATAAYRASLDPYWWEQAQLAYGWFHGQNDLGLSVYDEESGGCHDGLCLDRVNKNQGAESTLAFVEARLTIEEEMRRQTGCDGADRRLKRATERTNGYSSVNGHNHAHAVVATQAQESATG